MNIPVDRSRAYAIRPYTRSRNTCAFLWFVLLWAELAEICDIFEKFLRFLEEVERVFVLAVEADVNAIQ